MRQKSLPRLLTPAGPLDRLPAAQKHAMSSEANEEFTGFSWGARGARLAAEGSRRASNEARPSTTAHTCGRPAFNPFLVKAKLQNTLLIPPSSVSDAETPESGADTGEGRGAWGHGRT